MKKRSVIISALSVTAALALMIFVQPAQSLAMDVLSVFRVQDMRAINISVDDIQQIAQSVQLLQSTAQQPDKQDSEATEPGSDTGDTQESQFVTIDRAREFTAFDFKLPHSLDSQTPELKMIETQTQTVTIQTQEINDVLTKLGAQTVPDSLDGSQITVQTPATAIAEYSDNTLIETQMPVFSGDTQALSALSESILSLPMLTDNLRSQLASVDLTSGIVYVPVIEGFGQQTAVGNSTGYIYSMSDLQTLLASLPSGLLPFDESRSLTDQPENNISVLIWTNNGVLYVLTGNQPANELVQIAKSI